MPLLLILEQDMTINLRDIPRVSLGRSLSIAAAVREEVSGLTIEEVAASLKITPGTGGTNNRLIAARKYGLVKRIGGRIRITDLGRRVTSSDSTTDDHRDAIREVPVFAQLIDHFRSDPNAIPDADLDRAIVDLGVPEIDAQRVRKVFIKCWSDMHGASDRNGMASTSESAELPDPAQGTEKGLLTRSCIDGLRFTDHPVVAALLGAAPSLDEKWSTAKREDWLKALDHTMRLIFEE